MRAPSLALVLLFAIGTAAPEAAFAKDVDTQKVAEKLQKTWSKALLTNGFAPKVSDSGNLLFTRPFDGTDLSWVITIDAVDPTFFRVALPNIWPIESEAERAQVLQACNIASANIKVAKVYVVEDDVWISLELLLPKAKHAEDVMERSFELMDDAIRTFVSEMQRLGRE